MAAGQNRVGGMIHLAIDGNSLLAKGEFSYNLGKPKRTSVIGEDGTHGYTETAQPAFIEGAITDQPGLDLAAFCEADGVTATLQLANGKTIVQPDSYYVGEGTGKTKEGEIAARWESKSQGQEV